MRKKQSKKRDLIPDPKFNDQLVTRFVNNLMWDGKKSTALKIFYDALDIVDTKKQDNEKNTDFFHCNVGNDIEVEKTINEIYKKHKIIELPYMPSKILRNCRNEFKNNKCAIISQTHQLLINHNLTKKT